MPSVKTPTTTADALTDKQERIYHYIREMIQNRGYGPTVREIGRAFEIASPNGVICHLRALEKKGFIKRNTREARSIQLLRDPPGSERTMRLMGTVAAGVMHEAIENREDVDLAGLFPRDDCFLLKVRGDSMIEAHITEGDLVVVRRQDTASRGEMVVAQTSDGEATLKYWFPEAGRIRLQPANSEMEPIYVRDAKVMGKVVGVVRSLR